MQPSVTRQPAVAGLFYPGERRELMRLVDDYLQTAQSPPAYLPKAIIAPHAGDASPVAVSQLLERLWGGPETLIVISTDLSHYRNYQDCQVIDSKTSHAIEHLAPATIGYDQACGRLPLNGLLTTAKRRGLRVTTMDLRN